MTNFTKFIVGAVIFFSGGAFASWYYEAQIDKTGVLQLDTKTYTCQEYKGEMSK